MMHIIFIQSAVNVESPGLQLRPFRQFRNCAVQIVQRIKGPS